MFIVLPKMGHHRLSGLIMLMCTNMVFLIRGGHSMFLSGTYEKVLTTGQFEVYETQYHNSCAECSSTCIRNRGYLPYCFAFTCDPFETMCDFYTSGTTPLPGIQAFVMKETDTFHDISIGERLYSIYVHSVRNIFTDARKHCNDLGGYLLQFDDATEMNAVKMVFYGQPQGHYWVGANDLANEGIWVTDKDGTSASNWQWLPGQPDNYYDEDCATIFNNMFVLFDRPCGETRQFLCEKDI